MPTKKSQFGKKEFQRSKTRDYSMRQKGSGMILDYRNVSLNSISNSSSNLVV